MRWCTLREATLTRQRLEEKHPLSTCPELITQSLGRNPLSSLDQTRY